MLKNGSTHRLPLINHSTFIAPLVEHNGTDTRRCICPLKIDHTISFKFDHDLGVLTYFDIVFQILLLKDPAQISPMCEEMHD
jgi:hypothetical protein